MLDKALFALPGIRGVLAVLFAVALVRAGLIIGQALALAQAITALWQGAALADQYPLIAIFAACFVAGQGALWVEDRFMDGQADRRADELRSQLLARIFDSHGQIVRDHGTASVTAAALEGTDQVRDYLKSMLPKTVHVMVIPTVLLIAAFTQDIVSAVIMLVLLPVIVFYMVLLGNAAKHRAERQFATYQTMSNHFIDTLRGLDTLQAFGAAGRHEGQVYQVSERFRKATIETLRVATLSGAVLDLIATMGIGAVALMLGFRLMDGSIMLMPSLAVLVLAPEYFRPVRDFASDFHASLDGKNALANIQSIVQEADDAEAAEKTDGAGTAPDAAIAPWSDSSTLSLSGVGFTYPGGTGPALSDVSFTVTGFMKVGIVGISGSGKSTLAGLLGGFGVPDTGQICVDGQAVGSLQRSDWQHQVLYIPQSPYLFHTTLRENLTFYSPDADDELIRQAVEALGLQPLIDQLPQGMDTVIGEGGRSLSGGQAQRIALARALLDPGRKIMILDEPTAHLDIETEWELKERMLPLMEGRLVLFSTHRLHWLADMDRVLVLDGGRVVEQGAYADLMARDGALSQLAHRMNGDENHGE